MKKIIICLLLITGLLFSLSGCTFSSDSNSSSNASKEKESITLNVYNWGDYIDEDVLSIFTEETGIEINYGLYPTNEEMYQKIKSGGSDYDVIFPSDYMIEKMIREDLIQKLDVSVMPNYQHIDDHFKNLSYDPNNEYSVPYMWGTVGIVYNQTMVDDPIDSWDILWNEKYSQQIFMQDSVRDSFAVALKKLGYSLNSRNEDELEEAKNLLIAQRPLVLAYVVDEVKDKMIGNEAALAVMWSGDALYVQDENPDLKYVVPKEGSNLWFDAMAIPASSQHKKEAEQFIDFMSRPDIALKNTSYIGYSTPNNGAKGQLSEEILSNPAAYPADDILNRCEVLHDLGDYTEMYNDMWTEIRSY